MRYAGKADINVNGVHKHLRARSSVVKFCKLAKLKLKNKQFSHFQVLHIITKSNISRTFTICGFYLNQRERMRAKILNCICL
jgi:hypothetical protein